MIVVCSHQASQLTIKAKLNLWRPLIKLYGSHCTALAWSGWFTARAGLVNELPDKEPPPYLLIHSLFL